MSKFEGWRPWIFGDVWDKMSVRQRRSALISDIVVAIIGAILIYELAKYKMG
jgi:hypothetical protein